MSTASPASPGSDDSLRGALSGLTTRGQCFLAAGVACALVGLVVGERDLLRLAVFLVALPLVAVAVVSRTRYRLSLTRRIEPARLAAGRTATVVLRLENVSRLPSGTMLLEDTLPYALGGPPRFVLDRVEPRGIREVGYGVRGEARGRYPVGPMTVRLTDPFGLCELTRRFAAVDTLTVSPVVVPLPGVRLGGDWTGGGEATARSVATSGEDDAATREYRVGDDLRKVHWRSTARAGELMVRREEQPWQSRAALVLDTSADAHRGTGLASSFEWAVSATASIGTHLQSAGFTVRLLGDGALDVPRGGAPAEGALLDRLTVVETTSGAGLGGVLPLLRRGGEGLVVAVLGAVAPGDAEQLARLRHGSTTCVAVLLDVERWPGEPGAGRQASGAAAAKGEAAARDAAAGTARLLEAAGWRVLRVPPGRSLDDLWPQVGARSSFGASDAPAAAGAAADAIGLGPSHREEVPA